ncbi:MAG TPA: YfhO family protein, partial [Thermoanaerobaculia bacterium]|nr:YfhO family protein [Thermoanaerobaculia bacterium]
GRASYAVRVLLAGGGAIVLSLVQLGPTLEWVPQLWRSLHSWGHLPLSSIRTFLSRDPMVTAEFAGYAGYVTLFLVPFAFSHPNRRDVLFFSVLLVAAVEIAFGLPPFYPLSQAVPVVSGLPNGRFLLAADLSLAVLAGLALSSLERRDPGRARPGIPLLASAALAVLAAWQVFPGEPGIRSAAGSLDRSWTAEAFVVLGIGAVLLSAAAKTRRATWGIAALGIAAIDLFTYQHRQLSFTEARNVFPPAPVLDALRARTPEGERIATLNVTMGSNFEMMYGLKTPGGYDFLLRRTDRLLRRFGVRQGKFRVSAAALADPASAAILDLLGVRYLLATTFNASSSILERQPSRFPLALGTQSIRVFENPRALPRAFFLPDTAVRRYGTEDEEARAVLAPGFDPRRTLVLSGIGGATGAIGEGAETFIGGEHFAESPGRASFDIDAPGPGFAVVSESSYPGWRAWVDGRRAEVLRADYALQAVSVGPGRHRIVFRYRPPVFWICFAISTGAWVALAVFAVRRPRLSRAGNPTRERGGEDRAA